MKKLTYAAVALLALAIGGLLIVPGLIDWNRFKAPLAETLRAALGRAVTLSGDVRLSLLPVPTVSVTDVGVANPPGAIAADLLQLGRLDVQVALWPLFGGRIEIQTIAIDRPVLVLETLADGRRGWLTPISRPGGAVGERPLEPLVRFNQIEVRNGTVEWRDDDADSVTRLTGMTAHLTAAGLAGPFDLQGSANLHGLWGHDGTDQGLTVSIEAAAGNFGTGTTVPVRLSLALPDGDVRLHFAGLATAGTEPRLQGEVHAETAHPAGVAALLAAIRGTPLSAANLPPALSQPLALHGTLDATESAATLSNLELHLGDGIVTGNARLSPHGPSGNAALPNLEIRLAASRMELDPWLVSMPSALSDRAFTLPDTVTARLDLAVDAIGFHQDVLQRARLAAHLNGGIITLEQLAFQGPGGSDVLIAGHLDASSSSPDAPTLEATITAQADNPRRALDWLGIDVGTIAADRLRRLALTGRLRAQPGFLEATDVDLRLDTSHATGSLSYRRPPLEPGKLAARFDLDHIDLDAYRTTANQAAPPRPLASRLEAALKTVRALGNGSLIGHLGHLVINGLPLRDLDIDAEADDRGVVLRRLRLAAPSGATASIQGTVAQLVPIKAIDLSFTTETGPNDDALFTTLEQAFTLTLPPAVRRLEGLRLGGRVRGDDGRLTVALSAEGAGGRIDGQGVLAPGTGRPLEPLRFHGVFPETGRLVRALFADMAPGTTGAGVTDLSATVFFDRDRATVSEIQGVVAGVTVQGQVHADLTGARPWVDVRANAGDIDLDTLSSAIALPAAPATTPARRPGLWPGTTAAPPRYRWSLTPVDLSWLSIVDGELALTATGVTLRGRHLTAPVIRARLRDGALRLEQCDGELMGGQLSAIGRLAAVPQADATLTVTLNNAHLDHSLVTASSTPAILDVTAGRLDLDLTLASHGDSEMALIGALSGAGRFAITDGRFRGIDLPGLEQRIVGIRRLQDIANLLNLEHNAASETGFDRLQGTLTIEHGVASTNDIQLSAATGSGDAQGFVDLPNRTLNFGMHFRSHHQPPWPAIGMTLTGPLDRPHRTIDTGDLQRALIRKLTGAVLPPAPAPTAPGAIAPGGAGSFIRGLFRDPPAPQAQPTHP